MAFIDNPAAASGLGTRVATALWVQLEYAWLLIWPHRLSSDYSFDAIPVVRSPLDWRLWLGVLWALALAAAFVWSLRRSRTLALAIAAWVLFLLPSANLFFASGTIMAERLTYLASFGGCLALAHAGARAWQTAGARRAVLLALAALCLCLLAWRTVRRNAVWHDNLTLATHDAAVMPRSAKLQAGAGIALHARGELEPAQAAYERALAIYPQYAQIHFNLGQLLLDRREPARALEHLAQAARLAPENPRPYKNLAPLLEQSGRTEEALAAYAAGTALDPTDYPLRFNHGRLLLAAGRVEEGRRVLARLAHEDAGGLVGTLALALGHESEGRAAQAARLYRELLARADLPARIRDNVERQLRAIGELSREGEPGGGRPGAR
jgi:tetratricopeptide (TPR) repeat protein